MIIQKSSLHLQGWDPRVSVFTLHYRKIP